MNRRKRLYALIVTPVVVGIAATAAIAAAPSASAASRDEFCKYTLQFMSNIPNLDGNGDGLVSWSTIAERAFSPGDPGFATYFYDRDRAAFPYIETAGYAFPQDGLASWSDGNAAFNKQCL